LLQNFVVERVNYCSFVEVLTPIHQSNLNHGVVNASLLLPTLDVITVFITRCNFQSVDFVFVSITFDNQSESFFRVHSALFLALWFENIQITKASQEQFGEDKKLPEVPRFDSMIFKPAIFNLSKAGRLKPQLHKQNLPTQVSELLICCQSE
jgi:hypothetical protein